MAGSRADKIRFLRYVYTNGGDSATTRSAFIATLEVSEVASWKGKILVASSPGNASYELKESGRQADYAGLFEWAESFLDYDDITEAIEAIPPSVRAFSTSFSGGVT